MTIGLAWVGKRGDGREDLYIASDSRVTGGERLDACPKILTLPRSDCALCFAGHTAATFPLMLQIAYAIGAHEPARNRGIDINRVKSHLLRVFTDLVNRIEELPTPFSTRDAQFIFAGYSWLKKDFRVWTIYYVEGKKTFAARESMSFCKRLKKVAFIGDHSKEIRSQVAKELSVAGPPVYLEPLKILSGLLQEAKKGDSIGGPPQLVRVSQHMNTRSFCIRWNGEDTLFGRPLLEYENTDYWIVDPLTGKVHRPRKFGNREAFAKDAQDKESDV